MNSTINWDEILEKIETFSRYDLAVSLSIQALGLLGNVLMFVVYNQPSLHKLSVSIYFRCQAVFCACQNLHSLLKYLTSYTFLIDKSEASCKLVYYLLSLITPMSVWMEVVASLDRFLTIVYPTRFEFIRKTRFQRLAVLIILILNMACYLNLLITSHLMNDSICSVKFVDSLSVTDLVTGSAVPFVLMLILSGATLIGVLNAHNRVQHSASRPAHDSHRTRLRDIRFGVTMLVLNLLFFILNLPYHLNNQFDVNPFVDYFHLYVYIMVLNDLYDAYYSLAFYVHLAVNSVVRKESRRLLVKLFNASIRLVS